MNKRKVILLAQERPAVEGDLDQIWFEVARCGKYYDWRYGIFELTPELLSRLVENFASNVLGLRLALDCNHEDNHKALAWIAGIEVRGQSLFARFEDWTPEGEKAVRDGEYRYFSVDIEPLELPSDDGVKVVPDVLRGIAVTNRPVLKGMEGTFSEKEKPINSPADDAGNKAKRMKNMVLKFAESLLASDKVGQADVDRLNVMLADLPEADRAGLKESADKVAAKAAEAAKVELADKAKAVDTNKQLAESAVRLSALEKDNAVLLAEKKARETDETVNSMILSETVKKGFPKGKLADVKALVEKIGVENAKAVAAMLSEVTDVSGKTEEEGHGEAAPSDEAPDAKRDADERKLAEERAKASGNPVHHELAEVIKARIAAK